MNIIRIKEYGSVLVSRLISLSEAEDSASKIGAFKIYPDVLERGLIRVQKVPSIYEGVSFDEVIIPQKVVGLIPINESCSLWVEPKVPIRNIDYMSKTYGQIVSKNLSELRSYMPSSRSSRSLWENMTSALVDYSLQIVQRGPWRTYYSVRNNTGSLVGRINPSETISKYWSRNQRYRVASEYFIRSIDTPFNRVIKGALVVVAKTNAPTQLKQRCNRVLQYFGDIGQPSTDDIVFSGGSASRCIPESRGLYSHALPLARAILLDESVDLNSPAGNIVMDSFFVDMSDVFENYVRSVLQLGLNDVATVKDGNDVRNSAMLFSDNYKKLSRCVPCSMTNQTSLNKSHRAQPDIIIQGGNGSPLVIDAKYKPIENSGAAKREDVEQAVTYAVRFGSKLAITVHPCVSDEETGLYYSGSIGNISVLYYKTNLCTTDMEREQNRLVSTMKNLLAANFDLVQ